MQPKTNARGTRQGQPHRGALNGYNAERANRRCLGSGYLQARRAQLSAGLHVPRAAAQKILGRKPLGWGKALGFQLRPATTGSGAGVCVCLCACSAYTPPLLAAVCGVGVCAWAPVLGPPRNSWLGCWGVCVFVCALRLYLPLLAGVCGVCVSAWARVSAAPRHFWRVCWGVCVFVCDLRLHAATPGVGVRCGCVCLGLGFGCAPQLLAGLFRSVCVCVRARLLPHHSCVGRAVCWLDVAWHLSPVPWFVAGCASCPGLRHLVAVVAWHLSVCLGCGRRRASLAFLVALPWCAAPRPVRSLSLIWWAFPNCCPLAVGVGVRVWRPGTVPLVCVSCGVLCAAGVAGAAPRGEYLSPL